MGIDIDECWDADGKVDSWLLVGAYFDDGDISRAFGASMDAPKEPEYSKSEVDPESECVKMPLPYSEAHDEDVFDLRLRGPHEDSYILGLVYLRAIEAQRYDVVEKAEALFAFPKGQNRPSESWRDLPPVPRVPEGSMEDGNYVWTYPDEYPLSREDEDSRSINYLRPSFYLWSLQ